MNCLNWLQLKDSSNNVAIVVIILVLLLLIFVGYFSYRKAMNNFFVGASRSAISNSNTLAKSAATENGRARKVAEGLYEIDHMSKSKEEDGLSSTMVYSVA